MTPNIETKFNFNLHKKLKRTFNRIIENPVIKAQSSWSVISDQLSDVLGPQVHAQWFKNVKPLLLKNNILLLQTESVFASQWITIHYQELVEALLSAQNKNLSVFFIGPTKSNQMHQNENRQSR